MQKFRWLTVLAAFMAILALAAACSAPDDPLKGNLKVFPGGAGKGEQPPAAPPASPPAPPAAGPVERSMVITESNSVFSIGLPPGYREERQVTAEKPVDFWFEYVSPDVALQVNGASVEIPMRRTGARPGYTAGVTGFSYVMVNQTSQAVSYNLRIVPSRQGDQVPARTIEKWTAP